MGTFRSEATESISFVDKKNELSALITFGKVKKRYFTPYLDHLITSKAQSFIKVNPSAISMGHIVDI